MIVSRMCREVASIRRSFLAVAFLVGTLVLAACAAKEEAKPGPPAPPAPAPKAKPAWQEEWERLLEAAKREGKVAMGPPQGDDNREALRSL